MKAAGLTDAERERLTRIMKRENAYHEAGHAVIPWMFGVHSNLQFIDMRGTRAVAAYVRHRDEMVSAIQGNWDRRNSELFLHMKREAERRVMADLAGPAAADRVRDSEGYWYDELMEDWGLLGDDPNHDAGLAVVLTKALYGDTGRAWQFLRRMAQWTDEALSHPQVWAVVEALADRLQSTKTRLSGSSANRIMDRAWGLPGTFPLAHMGRTWRRRLGLSRQRARRKGDRA